jgi:hypothetical protein
VAEASSHNDTLPVVKDYRVLLHRNHDAAHPPSGAGS